MDRLQLEDLQSHLFPVPDLHCFSLQLTPNTNIEGEKKSVPVSIEEFECSNTKFTALTVFILLPGAEMFLKEGDLPKFETGTRMCKTGTIEQIHNLDKKVSKPVHKIKETRTLTE